MYIFHYRGMVPSDPEVLSLAVAESGGCVEGVALSWTRSGEMQGKQ